ncbi:hypothetical protein ACIP72_35995, partial [Streptomyces cyaneofuscatus]
QERLIYQARLQARFGRNWRRKAPVESMMPLRLAKYGVPLAETAPAGLAAAGIEEPEVITVERVEAVGEPVLRVGHQRAGEWADDVQQPAVAASEVPVVGEAEAVRETSELQPVLPDLDYVAAAEAFIQQRGGFPDARQFALFLALYDITDPTTGGPLPALLLEPVVDELWLQYRAREPVTERVQHETGSEDPMGSRPAEPDPQSEAAPVGERAPGQVGGTSAWFGSGQDAPSGSAPQATLEEVESWNEAARDTAPEEQRASSSSDSNAAVGAGAASGGATADRTGQGRRVVQIRIPEPHGGDWTPAHTPSGDGVGEPARKPVELVEEVAPVHEERVLSGAEVVAARYRELPAEERARSANALAPLLAEGTDYTVGTVRKYLGDIKRSEKETAVRH